jgi:hypothetical protein
MTRRRSVLATRLCDAEFEMHLQAHIFHTAPIRPHRTPHHTNLYTARVIIDYAQPIKTLWRDAARILTGRWSP